LLPKRHSDWSQWSGTTIISFLLVLIQNTQNRDGAALQAKLDDLSIDSNEVRNEQVAIERLNDGLIHEGAAFAIFNFQNPQIRIEANLLI